MNAYKELSNVTDCCPIMWQIMGYSHMLKVQAGHVTGDTFNNLDNGNMSAMLRSIPKARKRPFAYASYEW